MKIERELVPRMMLAQFADQYGLIMEIHERETEYGRHERYFCYFKRAEVKDGSILCSTAGDGDTEDEAMADYARNVSCKLLVINAYGKDRREILTPILNHVTETLIREKGDKP